MKTIELDCFANTTTTCEVTSELKNLQISNPLEHIFALALVNLGQNDCDLSLQLSSQANRDLWQKLPLTLSSQGKLFFRGQASELLEKEQQLEILPTGQDLELTFDFDLLPLLTAEERVDLDFALLINFSCQLPVAPSQLANDQSPKQAAASAVLAANQLEQGMEPIETAPPPPNYAPAWYLLSGLFVLGFFVIIKFVHGKKKK